MPIETTQGLQMAFDLAEFAAKVEAERFRRHHPDADDDAVEAAVQAWWGDRRCAPNGDAAGRVRRRTT